MTNPSDPQARPPLDADDPRLSEWIDGRLSVAEAAEVERAVLGSPALARLVDDLRAIKQAARQVPVASPPAGFADRVMEAVLSRGDAAADAAADRAVEQEWQSLEAERIAEERAEAEADRAAETSPTLAAPGRSWPWLTIAAALAAGLLVAVVLNRTEEGPREIAALAAKPELDKPELEDKLTAAARREAAPADEVAASPVPAPAAAAAVPPQAATAARSLEANGRLREQAKAAADAAGPDLPVVIAVASWTEFDQLLEAHGIEARPIEAPGPRDGNQSAGGDRADESGDWTLELSGPPAGLEALLAAAGGRGLEERQVAAGEKLERKAEVALTAPAAKQAEEAQLRRRESVGRLLVRLVIAKPASSTPAGPVPGEGEEGGEP